MRYPRTVPFSGTAPADISVSFSPQGHMAQEKSGAWQIDYRYNAAERLIETSQTDKRLAIGTTRLGEGSARAVEVRVPQPRTTSIATPACWQKQTAKAN